MYRFRQIEDFSFVSCTTVCFSRSIKYLLDNYSELFICDSNVGLSHWLNVLLLVLFLASRL